MFLRPSVLKKIKEWLKKFIVKMEEEKKRQEDEKSGKERRK